MLRTDAGKHRLDVRTDLDAVIGGRERHGNDRGPDLVRAGRHREEKPEGQCDAYSQQGQARFDPAIGGHWAQLEAIRDWLPFKLTGIHAVLSFSVVPHVKPLLILSQLRGS